MLPKPPHPATLPPARVEPRSLSAQMRPAPHPATRLRTVLLPTHPAVLGPKPVHAGAILRAQNTLATLKGHADNMEAFAKGEEIQILLLEGRYFICTNYPEQSTKLKDKVGQVATELSIANSKEIAITASPAAAAGKADTVPAVLLHGQSERNVTKIHAEQSLLATLAMWIRGGKIPDRTSYVAGNKAPCSTCYPVVKAFADALTNVYGKSLEFVDQIGQKTQGDGISVLDIPVDAKTDKPYYTYFVERYKSTLAKVQQEVREKI